MANMLRDSSTWSMLAFLQSWTQTNCSHCHSDGAQAMAELQQATRVARLSSFIESDVSQPGCTSAYRAPVIRPPLKESAKLESSSNTNALDYKLCKTASPSQPTLSLPDPRHTAPCPKMSPWTPPKSRTTLETSSGRFVITPKMKTHLILEVELFQTTTRLFDGSS
jgi:hypothetical protein